MKLRDWLSLAESVALLVVGKSAPAAAPVVAHGIVVAEHALDSRGRPLSSDEKTRLAVDVVGVGLDALTAAGHGVDLSSDDVGDLVDDVVQTTNAVHAALAKSATAVAKSGAVELASSVADVQRLKDAAKPAQAQSLLVAG